MQSGADHPGHQRGGPGQQQHQLLPRQEAGRARLAQQPADRHQQQQLVVQQGQRHGEQGGGQQGRAAQRLAHAAVPDQRGQPGHRHGADKLQRVGGAGREAEQAGGAERGLDAGEVDGAGLVDAAGAGEGVQVGLPGRPSRTAGRRRRPARPPRRARRRTPSSAVRPPARSAPAGRNAACSRASPAMRRRRRGGGRSAG